jgi:hypothetical protein
MAPAEPQPLPDALTQVEHLVSTSAIAYGLHMS